MYPHAIQLETTEVYDKTLQRKGPKRGKLYGLDDSEKRIYY